MYKYTIKFTMANGATATAVSRRRYENLEDYINTITSANFFSVIFEGSKSATVINMRHVYSMEVICEEEIE